MDKRFLISALYSLVGVAGGFGLMIPFGETSLAVTLVCYFIIYEKYREYFWRSFIIGAVIGIPLGLYIGFNYYMISAPIY